MEQAPPRVAVTPPPTRANAWEDVSDLSASLGVKLDDWQDAVLQAAMGERLDGTWAADVVGLSVPRQNGKSQLLVARALAGAILFGEQKIIISAHSQDTAREAFGKLLDMRDASPALDARIVKVMTALNREFVKFDNGAVIQFKARTVSGSRGFSCDCLLLDEAQILGMPAWVSIRSTMSARPNPQAWLLGTPPTPEDNGEVFTSVRESAMSGKTRRTAWLEWAASPDDDPALDSTRATANPAWWTRVNHEVVQGEYETYPADRFAWDRLGIWSSDLRTELFPGFTNLGIAFEAVEPSCVGIGVTRGASHAALVTAGQLSDGRWLVDIAEDDQGNLDHAAGTAWLAARLLHLQETYQVRVVMDTKCPDANLATRLRDAGINLDELTTEQMFDAFSATRDAVAQRQVAHFGSQVLTQAMRSAAPRHVGDRILIGRKQSGADISPAEAATIAVWGAMTHEAEPSAYFI